MSNGEIVPRSWLIYLQETNKAFCFCCKLFSNSKSPFSTDSNTWKGMAKKLKEHENGTAHKKCFKMLWKSSVAFTFRWSLNDEQWL